MQPGSEAKESKEKMRARLELEEIEKRLERKELIDARVRYACID